MTVVEELEQVIAPARSALPLGEYKGSLAFIDRLPTAGSVRLGSRAANAFVASDIFGLTGRGRVNDLNSNAVSTHSATLPRDYSIDNRRWTPTRVFNPGEVVSGASTLVPDIDPDSVKRLRKREERVFKEWRNPHINYSPLEGKRKGLMFLRPDKLWICLKRKMRREIMHAYGYAGVFYRPKYITPFTRVRC